MLNVSPALTWISLAGLIAGVVLLLIGLRGRRVGDHPHCRRCGFDLCGRPVGTHLCGECGASLDAPRAIEIGLRQRRPAIVLLGLIAVASCGTFIAPNISPTFAAARVALARVEGGFIERRLAAQLHDVDPTRRAAAWRELWARVKADAIGSAGTRAIGEAALDDRIDEPMRAFGDRHDSIWLLRRQFDYGEVDETLIRRALQLDLYFRLDVARRSPRGQMIRFRIVPPADRPTVADDVIVSRRVDTLDGHPIGPATVSPLAPTDNAVADDHRFGTCLPLDPSWPAGVARLSIRFAATAIVRSPGRPPIVETRDVVLDGRTEIVEPIQLACPPLAMPADPDEATPLVSIKRHANGSGVMRFRGPAFGAILADVFLHDVSGERALGPIYLDGFGECWVAIDPLPVAPFEVEFRPTPWRGAELFEPVPTYDRLIVVTSTAVEQPPF